jgi:excisionase family DNA binding protein
MTNPDLLTVADVMARLQVGRHTVYDLIRSRRLHSVRIGRCRRIPATSLNLSAAGLFADPVVGLLAADGTRLACGCRMSGEDGQHGVVGEDWTVPDLEDSDHSGH